MSNSWTVLLRRVVAISLISPSAILADTNSQLTINVSGAPGKSSTNGQNAPAQTRKTVDGVTGEDASAALPGQNAGQIVLSLFRKLTGSVQVKGQILRPINVVEISHQVEREEFEKVEIDLSVHGSRGERIKTIARGGDGGNGGIGGRGGKGGKGTDGEDANRLFDGSDGRRAGNGGHGGRGTHGADSGNGGKIELNVNIDDTDLLLVIGEVNVSAGDPGQPGQHGMGGDGGDRGRDGSDYSYEDCDSDGECSTETNSGGAGGRAGRDGPSHTYTLNPGKRGNDGKFTIVVDNNDGTRSQFLSRYNLKVTSFKITDENRDSIIEPGEKVIISNIKLKNFGGMPSPKRTILVRLEGSRFKTVSEPFAFSQVVQRDETVELMGELTAVISDDKPKTHNKRYSVTEHAWQHLHQTGIETDHPGADSAQDFTVTYPIEISPINVPKSLAPGQSAMITWKVKNISGLPFGSMSEVKRIISTHLSLDSKSINTQRMTFTTPDGNVIELNEAFIKAIENLPANGEVIIQGYVNINQNAVPYSKSNLSLNLAIGERNNPLQSREIQTNSIQINVAKTYKKTPGSHVLIVVNSKTQTQELQAWQNIIGHIGLVADVWDISYQGFLDLSESLNGQGALSELYKDGIVIVLNNEIEKGILAESLVSRDDIKKIIKNSQTNFLFASQMASEFLDLNQIAISGGAEFRLKTVKEVFARIKDLKGTLAQPLVVHAKEVYRWREPQEGDMIAIGQSIVSDLVQLFPQRNFVVSYNYNPVMTDDGIFGDEFDLGQIAIFEEIESTEKRILGVSAPSGTDISYELTIESRNMIRQLIDAIPLELKVKLFVDLQLKPKSITSNHPLPLLADGIYFDIRDELNILLELYSGAPANEQLLVLNKLVTSFLKTKAKFDLKNGEMTIALMSRIQYMAGQMVSKKGRVFSRLDNKILSLVEEKTEQIVKNHFGEIQPSDSTIAAFFGATKSSKQDVELQESAIASLQSQTERLWVQAKGGVEPLYWLADDSGVRNGYSMTSNIQSVGTRLVPSRKIEATLESMKIQNEKRQKFMNDRVNEQGSFAVESF